MGRKNIAGFWCLSHTPAFRSKAAAIREATRRWAGQPPGSRTGTFTAKLVSFIEPDYGIEVEETPIDELDEFRVVERELAEDKG